MRIADGLDLLPGEDGILPVRLRWVALVDTPEAFSVDDERVYVAGSELIAFNLGDGSIAWQYDEDDEALESDGSVVLRGADVAEHGRTIANVGSGDQWRLDLGGTSATRIDAEPVALGPWR